MKVEISKRQAAVLTFALSDTLQDVTEQLKRISDDA